MNEGLASSKTDNYSEHQWERRTRIVSYFRGLFLKQHSFCFYFFLREMIFLTIKKKCITFFSVKKIKRISHQQQCTVLSLFNHKLNKKKTKNTLCVIIFQYFNLPEWMSHNVSFVLCCASSKLPVLFKQFVEWMERRKKSLGLIKIKF